MASSPKKNAAFHTLTYMLHSICVPAVLTLCAIATSTALAEVTPLRSGWEIQSGCTIHADGAAISAADFKPVHWIAATVPSTVFAAQIAAGVVKDPDFGVNLQSAPGMTTKTPPPPSGRAAQNATYDPNAAYQVGANFATSAMPADSPYQCSWWYRKTFTVPSADKSKIQWLRFGGINYRANIWINGKQVADSQLVQGAFQTFEFDVTKYLIAGKENVLAVETFAPTVNDLAMAWADWNPMPPDKEMGLWGTVDLVTTGPVEVEAPFVSTHFADPSLKEADLTIYAELRSGSEKQVHGTLTATLEGTRIELPVDIGPGEKKSITFAPDQYAKLKVPNPRIWWPWQMGQPNLQTLNLTFTVDGSVSDRVSTHYGIREITSELIDKSTQGDHIVPASQSTVPEVSPPASGSEQPPQNTYRLFRVNGQPILIRGGGWTPDMMLRNDPAKLRKQFRMVRDLGLNTIRSEGKMETEDFFDIADQQGILIMIGWTCCDRWERFDHWTGENRQIAVASLHSQIMRLRNRPSVVMWLNGSDNPPTAEIERLYLNEEAELHWPNPLVSSATARRTTVTGESGVKMNGPYDFVTPSYWLTDEKYGGAWGFATEIGPGPAIPTLDSMRKFLPDKDIWPHDDVWKFHAGGGGFKDVTVFNKAMDNIYGPAQDVVDYDRVAQTMAYDGERAMFEAYNRNKYHSTGVIQWMLNNAWPSVIWHLYDYYLGTGGGYFGTKKANEPVHIQYSYDDHSIWVINSTYTPTGDLIADATVYDAQQVNVFSHNETLALNADGSARAFPIPDAVFAAGSPSFFVDLKLTNKAGATVSRNFYWVSANHSTYDWARTRYTTTPILTYENLTALRTLPRAKLDSSLRFVGDRAEIRLHNPSKTLAFQVAVSVDDSAGLSITPVLWSDNYIELMPGESITLSSTLPPHLTGKPVYRLSGWNIETQTLHPVNVRNQ
jgi:exo-1,4-beta-D-glucosaminidase